MSNSNTAKKPSIGSFIVGGVAIAIFIGMFFIIRAMVVTWCLTALPGDDLVYAVVVGGVEFPGLGPDITAAVAAARPTDI